VKQNFVIVTTTFVKNYHNT